MEFFMPMKIPSVTHQQHKVTVRYGKPHFYEPEDLADARKKFRVYLSKHRPKKPLEGALQLVTKWQYNQERRTGWKTTRPDTDNLIKLLKDCMTDEGFWNDDRQVASETTQKFYGNIEGIYVKVSSLT